MTKRINLVVGVRVATAASVSGITTFGAGGSSYRLFVIMSGSFDYGLRSENFVANRADYAIGQACFGAGCRITGYSFLGMSKSRDLSLCSENFFANGADHAIGQACFGAGCR
ncbi:MAG: hypothetical protein J6B12_00945, partial [Clostridia bacterium]|nr:hypothetical protein [Clostridia bacterium]